MFNRGPPQGDGGFFANFFGAGQMNQMNQRFDVQYQCFPVSFLGREDLECGNKILLPTSALDHLARLNISYPMLFEVSNGSAQRTHCGVMEFSAEEGTCYIPYWMMQNLLIQEGDLVRVLNTSLPKGNHVKLRPVTTDFTTIHNPRAVLENCLSNFATLTKGDCIAIMYNNKRYEIEIMECKPANAICIIETDVNVDFAPPKDYVEPPPMGAAGGDPFSPGSSMKNFAGSEASSPDKNFGGSSSSAVKNLDFAGRGLNGGSDAGAAPGSASSHVDADAASSIASSRSIFTGTGLRLDGKAAKLDQLVASPRQIGGGGTSGAGSDTDDEPWVSKRIPGGVRSKPPYGYNTGSMVTKERYEMPTGGKKQKRDEKVEFEMSGMFSGAGNTLE